MHVLSLFYSYVICVCIPLNVSVFYIILLYIYKKPYVYIWYIYNHIMQKTKIKKRRNKFMKHFSTSYMLVIYHIFLLLSFNTNMFIMWYRNKRYTIFEREVNYIENIIQNYSVQYPMQIEICINLHLHLNIL